MATNSSEFEDLLRPHIRGRSRNGDGLGRNRALRSLLAPERRPGGGAARYDAGETAPDSRRCVVKSHYVRMDAAGRDASRRHLLYLERDGVDRDGTPGSFYGVGETFDRAAFEAPLPGEKRQFRLIVSPEDAAQVDLQAFVRELVAQMEKDLNRPLLWAAVNHYNTEHPHAHVVIRGVDAQGRDLFIPERYIQKDMRARAEQQLTRELGPRTEREIAQLRAHEIEQERFASSSPRSHPSPGRSLTSSRKRSAATTTSSAGPTSLCSSRRTRPSSSSRSRATDRMWSDELAS